MALTFRGRAQVEGVTNAIDVILNHTMRTMGMTQSFDEVINQDEHGEDCAWKASNEKYEGDLDMWLMATSTSTRAQVASSAAFSDPLTFITISTCEITHWNGGWQIVNGGAINLENAATGKQSYRLRRYAGTTQRTLASTIPS